MHHWKATNIEVIDIRGDNPSIGGSDLAFNLISADDINFIAQAAVSHCTSSSTSLLKIIRIKNTELYDCCY